MFLESGWTQTGWSLIRLKIAMNIATFKFVRVLLYLNLLEFF